MAGVAHEVRNPLTAIRGYVQIIRQQTTLPVHQEYLSVVLNEIDSINKVIQQLLDFSRPRQSQWQQVQLKALIEEALITVQTSGVERGSTLVRNSTPSCPRSSPIANCLNRCS